jgi:hypothetical protein
VGSEPQILVSVPVLTEIFGLNHNRSFGSVLAVILVSAEISVQNTAETYQFLAFFAFLLSRKMMIFWL